MQNSVDPLPPYGQVSGNADSDEPSETLSDRIGNVEGYADIPNSTFDALALTEIAKANKEAFSAFSPEEG